MTKMWNNIPINKRCKNLEDFKAELKINMKPPSVKHFSKGSKHGNKLITRLRVSRSDLNLHIFNPILPILILNQSFLMFPKYQKQKFWTKF